MNLNDLNGYEFEVLMGKVFKHMGFVVEQTSLSNDGGIDIILYNNSLIYKGKYIVQCKNWNTSVGQPPVRDLYGVVMSERANKGILITTSSFTKQALEFADGKNIELIDGRALVELISEFTADYDINVNNKVGKKFAEYNTFDNSKYLYLKGKIENNKGEKQYYDELRQFYHEYVLSDNYEINKSGLIEEYIELNNEIISRFCKGNAKKNFFEKKGLLFMNGFLLVLKGKLFKAMEIFIDLNNLSDKKYMSLLPITCKSNCMENILNGSIKDCEEIVYHGGRFDFSHYRTNTSNSPWVMFKNLLIIFHKYKFKLGIDYINKFHINNKERFDKVGNQTHIFQKSYEIDNTETIFTNIGNNSYNKFHLPIKHITNIDKKTSEFQIEFNNDKYIDVNTLIDVYYNGSNINIEEELKKIEILLK